MSIFEITLFGINIAPSYYGLMYAIGFLSWYYIIKKRAVISSKLLDDLLIYMVLWVILGWRIWYILFYNFWDYIANPLNILKVWEWWMSFHGWILWVTIGMILFSKFKKISFYKLADQISLVVPIGLWLGRFWNYLNKELLGYSWYSWPLSINWQFPSPLVEMLLEWIVIFIVLNWLYKKIPLSKPFPPKEKGFIRFDGQIASIFIILYWIFRIFVEAVFREPDSHVWYIWNYFTLWEIYSLPMIIIWVYFYFKLNKK